MNYNTDKARTVKVNNVPKKYYSVDENADSKKTEKLNSTKDNVYYVIRRINKMAKRLLRKVLKVKKTRFVATSILSIMGVMMFTLLTTSFTFGYTVRIDDTVVGTVATKGEYYEALDMVKTEVRDIADVDFEPDGEETFQVELVKREDFTEKEKIAENLKSISEDMHKAVSISCDGEFVAAFLTREEAENVLEMYLNDFKDENEDVTVEFAQDVKITDTHVLEEAIKTVSDVYAEISKGKVIYHEVDEDETIDDVSSLYGISAKEIIKENKLGKNKDIKGMTLAIYTGEPYFTIKTVEYINGEVDIPFETETFDDGNIYIGKTEVDIEGVCGRKFVEAYVTKINGVVTEENILKSEVIKEPVTQVERKGTKERPSHIGTADFAMPTSGRLTSNFGSRWGRKHSGVDLAATVGTPIYASDNGIVTEAEYKNNGYGNFVSIDHGNGYVTYYAHCHELLVSEGDVVAKGDLIARVGNTGRSTGPHLHFEIRSNGVAQNPMNYLK